MSLKIKRYYLNIPKKQFKNVKKEHFLMALHDKKKLQKQLT